VVKPTSREEFNDHQSMESQQTLLTRFVIPFACRVPWSTATSPPHRITSPFLLEAKVESRCAIYEQNYEVAICGGVTGTKDCQAV